MNVYYDNGKEIEPPFSWARELYQELINIDARNYIRIELDGTVVVNMPYKFGIQRVLGTDKLGCEKTAWDTEVSGYIIGNVHILATGTTQKMKENYKKWQGENGVVK